MVQLPETQQEETADYEAAPGQGRRLTRQEKIIVAMGLALYAMFMIAAVLLIVFLFRN